MLDFVTLNSREVKVKVKVKVKYSTVTQLHFVSVGEIQVVYTITVKRVQ